MLAKRKAQIIPMGPTVRNGVLKLPSGYVILTEFSIISPASGEQIKNTNDIAAKIQPKAVSMSSNPTMSTVITGNSDANDPVPIPNITAYITNSGYVVKTGMRAEASPMINNIAAPMYAL